MGWDDLVRSVLQAVAKPILQDGLMTAVKLETPTGLDAYAAPVFDGTYTSPLAVVTDSTEAVTTARGETVIAQYRVQFLEAVAVTLNDRITLPDGRSAPILRVDDGVLDDAGEPLLTGVVCG